MPEADARRWCGALARSHYENFPVLTALVPERARDDFAAVYAFCRWSDDLGDESGSRAEATALLGWWRSELDRCYDGAPRHPVFVALRPAILRCDLPRAPFDQLISAFELDQQVDRYETWEQLVDYCRLSADPVGRLVLMLLEEPRDPETFRLSDSICTALQLTNHWQDIRRDRLDRNRVYIPRELNRIEDFERRLEVTVGQGYGCDRAFLEETRCLVADLVERTWPYFDEGRSLLDRLRPQSVPVVRLFVEGGEHVLRLISRWNHETVLHRPSLSKGAKAWMVARAWIGARWAARGSAGASRGAPVRGSSLEPGRPAEDAR
ncbi:MAG TPA: squalene synthase HpnC [Phycisphaerales bacterium]|nr:squalene synthase HpnC [Phycisphaerales bacterium]HMP36480.1 squalene synthase HpnC [Phycisphaerales bacterium]